MYKYALRLVDSDGNGLAYINSPDHEVPVKSIRSSIPYSEGDSFTIPFRTEDFGESLGEYFRRCTVLSIEERDIWEIGRNRILPFLKRDFRRTIGVLNITLSEDQPSNTSLPPYPYWWRE